MSRQRMGLLVVLTGLSVILGGCGVFNALNPNNTVEPVSSDDIWVDSAAYADAPIFPMGQGGGSRDGPQFVPGQLIVELKSGKFADATINALSSKHRVQVRGRINQLRLILVSLPAGADLEAAKARLEAESDVQSVGLNYVYQLFESGSPAVSPQHITNDDYMPPFQWGLSQIGFNRIAATVLPTSTPIVAVVDTGVDYLHPDIGTAKVIKGPDYFDGDMDPRDTTGHGTHVAGIAAALTDNQIGVAGVAGMSKVLAVRVGKWWIPVFSAAAGVTYAANYQGVRVINLSWGGSFDSKYIGDAVAYAVGKGILVVASAGNDDIVVPMYPAAYPGVLAVGATDRWDRKACFSNYGNYVDIAAPGMAILSTLPSSGYGFYDGTSMAAPFVAGAAALVWGKWPTLTRDQVADLLTTTGDPVYPDECSGHEFPSGVERLNVYNAFAARMTMPPAGGALVGLVVDANNGLGLQGTTVTARSGTITRTATTRADGTFTITNLPAGDYTVTASKSGYITTPDESTWTVSDGDWTSLPFFALPKAQAADVWTAVLEWRGWCGCDEIDLYLWLPGTLPDRNKYMVGWWARGNLSAHPFARFLRDEPFEMPWRFWGPLYTEALVFQTRYSGTYTFSVHDFPGSCDWWCCGAVVRLYRGTTLIGTYRVADASGSGWWWTVFRVSGSQVTPVQELSDDFPGLYGEEYFVLASQQKPQAQVPKLPRGQYERRPR